MWPPVARDAEAFFKSLISQKINRRPVLDFVTVFEKTIFFPEIFRNYEIFQNRKMHLKKILLQLHQYIAQKKERKKVF